eukprot:m.136757 g.136757  ORF g.136757 m.136757 type:complete len:57 (-) comp29878_c0_seq3:11-181(-)
MQNSGVTHWSDIGVTESGLAVFLKLHLNCLGDGFGLFFLCEFLFCYNLSCGKTSLS